MIPILFVHGLIGHMRAPEIAAKFGDRALTPDLLGYGDNTAASEEITLPEQVEYLRWFLMDRGIERAHIAGHSIGGAIAMLFAKAYPDSAASVISIEGNFTLKDAFWSKTLAEMPLEDVERSLQRDRSDLAGWLRASGVEPTPERLEAARSHLANQPASTVSAMAKSVVEITASPEYLDGVMTVLNNGTRVHLIAGARSRDAWDVPAFVLDNADMTLVPDTGHLVTIESPQAFADALATLIQ